MKIIITIEDEEQQATALSEIKSALDYENIEYTIETVLQAD